MGKMECTTIRRGYFRGSTAAENTGTFGIAGSVHRPWDSNPSRKNEIECCVDRLNPPPIADIRKRSAQTDRKTALRRSLLNSQIVWLGGDAFPFPTPPKVGENPGTTRKQRKRGWYRGCRLNLCEQTIDSAIQPNIEIEGTRVESRSIVSEH